jgi:hypothetical protein
MDREGREKQAATGENSPTERIRRFTVRNGPQVSGLVDCHGGLPYRVDDNAVRVGWRAVDI